MLITEIRYVSTFNQHSNAILKKNFSLKILTSPIFGSSLYWNTTTNNTISILKKPQKKMTISGKYSTLHILICLFQQHSEVLYRSNQPLLKSYNRHQIQVAFSLSQCVLLQLLKMNKKKICFKCYLRIRILQAKVQEWYKRQSQLLFKSEFNRFYWKTLTISASPTRPQKLK